MPIGQAEAGGREEGIGDQNLDLKPLDQVKEGEGERQLRALIALRSISRSYEAQQILVQAGVIQRAVEICQGDGAGPSRGR